MTSTNPRDPAATPPAADERRTGTRGRFHLLWDLVFRGLRATGLRASSFYTTVGVFLIVGVLIAVAGTLAFAQMGDWVKDGATQGLDVATLRWLKDHHTPLLTNMARELTYLGTGTVVLMIVAVAALFLWHTRHKHSAILLLAAVSGNIILNGVLKYFFHRDRPTVFDWQTSAVSSSFPSGHAMSATVCYGTVAYLVIRLQKRRWSQWLTGIAAGMIILLICATRLYLGVHYPSDVVAGILVGLAWAGFCMATLEASLVLARRRSPQDVVEERRAPGEPR